MAVGVYISGSKGGLGLRAWSLFKPWYWAVAITTTTEEAWIGFKQASKQPGVPASFGSGCMHRNSGAKEKTFDLSSYRPQQRET